MFLHVWSRKLIWLKLSTLWWHNYNYLISYLMTLICTYEGHFITELWCPYLLLKAFWRPVLFTQARGDVAKWLPLLLHLWRKELIMARIVNIVWHNYNYLISYHMTIILWLKGHFEFWCPNLLLKAHWRPVLLTQARSGIAKWVIVNIISDVENQVNNG